MKKKTSKLSVRNNAWYGWVPDPPDHRDKLYGAEAKRRRSLPSKVDLRGRCLPSTTRGDWAVAQPTRSPAHWSFWNVRTECFASMADQSS